MKNIWRRQEGFTLLEIIIVIAILWLFTASLGLFLRGFLGRGEVEAAELQRRAVESAAMAYYLDAMNTPGTGGGRYPTNSGRGAPPSFDSYINFDNLVDNHYLASIPPDVAADNPGGSPEGRHLWYINGAGNADFLVLNLTPSPTATMTPPPLPTNTPTPVPSPSNTPTATPTPDPTDTPTATPTPDPSITPTATPTPDPSNTATPTVTASPSPTYTPTPTATVAPTAYDGFEGAGWSNGYGWKTDWYHEGDAENVAEGDPHSGQKHLRLRRDTGFASRTADLSGKSHAYLTFWARVDSFEAVDYATALVKPTGGDWTVIQTFTSADAGSYRLVSVDLSGFSLGNDFSIAFKAGMGDVQDRFYIDDVALTAW